MNSGANKLAERRIDWEDIRALDLRQFLFSFGKYGEQPYHRYFRFLPEGRIGGHRHPNETRWEFRDNHIVLLSNEGIVTTRIDQFEITDSGKLRLVGPMLSDPTGSVVHCWEQIDEPYAMSTDPSAFELDRHGLGKPRRNLVIMGANEQSLHHEWPQNIPDADRNWDLCLSFYGKPENYPPRGPVEYTSLQPGVRKWIAIHRAMHVSSPFWEYQRILVLDDDIRTNWLDINRFFEIVEQFDMVLAQPSLTSDSHITHPITEQQPDSLVRFTTFVEAMAPCFTIDALRLCISTTQEGFYGFGIDHLWPRILGLPQNRIGIVDAVAMEHTRPLAVNYSLREAKREESDLFDRYGMGGGLGSFETGRIWRSFRGPAHIPQSQDQPGNSKALSSSMPRIMVAFRTHLWDENVAAMARRLAGSAVGLDFCVVADETHGHLSIPTELKKLGHTDDFSDLGLPNYPPSQVLWYNADYPLYRLRRAFPDVHYFVLSEYDVLVNLDLSAMLSKIHNEQIDLLVGDCKKSTDSWGWNRTLTNYFEQTYSCLLPFMVVSAQAIDFMLNRRRHFALQREYINRHEDWPYCEGFVPSCLMSNKEFKVGSLERYAALPHYVSWPPISTLSPLNQYNQVINHPVLSGPQLISKLTNEITLDTALNKDGCLYDENYRYDRVEIAKSLYWRYRAMGRAEELTKLAEFAHDNSIYLPTARKNIAYQKAATQSSICEWSIGTSVEEDAKRVIGPRQEIRGNHTAYETNPWWQCDLGEILEFDKIVLFNRLEVPERCTKFVVLKSNDSANWSTIHVKVDSSIFGGADGRPYEISFDNTVSGQFIRIQIIGEGVLHLDRVEVFSPIDRNSITIK